MIEVDVDLCRCFCANPILEFSLIQLSFIVSHECSTHCDRNSCVIQEVHNTYYIVPNSIKQRFY